MTSAAPSVPYLDRKRIELESKLLLESFQAKRSIELVPPIPVEEILELHLGLSLAIRPLREIFGVDDVLGAIWFESREVLVDEQNCPALDACGLHGRLVRAQERMDLLRAPRLRAP
jgi:hypothetical protein